MNTKKAWLRILVSVVALLVVFSRMYLGCHTPADVIVGVVTSIPIAVAVRLYFKKNEQNPLAMRNLLFLMIGLTALYLVYVSFWRFPADVEAENLEHAQKNAYTLAGCVLGLLLGEYLDRRCIHFEVKAVWWAQIVKAVLGLGLLLGIKAGLKPVLQAVLPVHPATLVRYFLMVVFASAVWPLTFARFAKLGKKEETKA